MNPLSPTHKLRRRGDCVKEIIMKTLIHITKTCTVAALVSLTGCGGMQMQSVWNHKEFKTDASLAEWPDTVWNEKDGIRFAVMNDEEYLYFALVALKQDLRRQIMMRGLTIWFDPLAREKQTIGVRYPMGLRDGMQRRPGEGDFGGALAGALAEFEYISPLEETPQRVSVVAGKGVELRIHSEEGSLTYELKVPLKPSTAHPYSLESSAGSTISVGVEVSGFERRSVGGSGPPSGGGGRGRGTTSIDPRAGAITSMEPISVWATVQLAALSH